MAFESLSDKLQNVFKTCARQGPFKPKRMSRLLRSKVKMALLEADVNFKV